MKQWVKSLQGPGANKPIPVLSFPCVSLLGITVRGLISDSELQAKGMKLVADRTDAGASMILLNDEIKERAEEIARSANTLDLSTNPVFSDQYMSGMMLEEA